MRPIELKKQTIKRRKRIVATLPDNTNQEAQGASSDGSSYDLEDDADTCTELASQETVLNTICSPVITSKKRSRGDDERAAAEALMSVGICRTRTMPPSLASSPSLSQLPAMANDDLVVDYKKRKFNSKTPSDELSARTTLAVIPSYNNYQVAIDKQPLKPGSAIHINVAHAPPITPSPSHVPDSRANSESASISNTPPIRESTL